ncbi:MAG: DEAD/DEAH box helicase, partial [Nitrolancea sp.]
MSTSRHGTQIDHTSVIKKMFALEARKGFQDTAVSGGFERYFGGLHTKTRHGDLIEDERIARLASMFAGYGELDQASRRERLEQARAILESPGVADASPPRQSRQPSTEPRSRKAEHVAKRTVTRRPARKISIPSLNEPVSILPGVGEGRTRQLATLGVSTIRDLLYLLPRHHKDYSQVQKISSMLFHHECTILGEVLAVDEQRTRSGKPIVHVDIGDDTGRVRAIWFNPYVARQMTPGTQIAISGRVEQQRGLLCFHNPEWELVDAEMLHTGRLVPVYPLTRGLYQKQVRNLTRMALDGAAELLQEPLSEETRQRQRLISMPRAITDIHFPDSVERLQSARNRLAFDEFLVLQVGLVRRKVEWQSAEGHAFNTAPEVLERFFGVLPFSLTGAQRRALDEIFGDMSRPRPMSRLLQGDVGSGKTVVAAGAAMVAIADGHQVALLAPTEILAEQHFRNLSELLGQLPEQDRPQVALLTGKSTAAERQTIDEGLSSGEINLIVGTHAILEEHVEFERLGLAIIDEQHRFGVGQRATLRDKGWNPDVLVMTATPIPRSLALV